MKILVTGSNGQLGNEVKNQFTDFDVIYTDIGDLDISDIDKIATFVKNNRIDTIINCAAFTNVDACETDIDSAMKINALGVRNLAIAAQENNGKLIHISTDYVFSGERTDSPYREWDLPNPATIYGKSKLLGEKYAAEFCERYYILRTAWLYGQYGGNFVKTISRVMEEKNQVKVVNDQIGNPTNCEDLVIAVKNLLKTENYGIFHATCEGECSWYDFAMKIKELKGKNAEVLPCTTAEFPRPAKRPAYSSLDNCALRNTIGNCFRNWEDALYAYFGK